MCNSAVQCGRKEAQSSGVDESTIEYLAKMTTAISPSFSEERGASVHGLRPLRRGARRINHTTLYINS